LGKKSRYQRNFPSGHTIGQYPQLFRKVMRFQNYLFHMH
jgi:hypothetical protein